MVEILTNIGLMVGFRVIILCSVACRINYAPRIECILCAVACQIICPPRIECVLCAVACQIYLLTAHRMCSMRGVSVSVRQLMQVRVL
jgi:hypothetical protein